MKKLILAGLVLSMSACMKTPDTSAHYGPEADINTIQQSTNIDNDDPSVIKKGELSYIEYMQQIQNFDSTLSQQVLLKVTDRTEDSSNYNVTVMRTVNEFVDGHLKTNSKEQGYLVPKSKPATVISQINEALKVLAFTPADKVENVPNQIEKPTDSRITYHNLNIEEGKMLAPALVRIRPDCGGLPSCDFQMQYKKITYDEVQWINDKGLKTHWSYLLSPDAPYLSRYLKICAETWVEVTIPNGTQVVPVTQCEEVKNFTFQE